MSHICDCFKRIEMLRISDLNFCLNLYWDISQLFRDTGYWGEIIWGYLQKLLWNIGILGVFLRDVGYSSSP